MRVRTRWFKEGKEHTPQELAGALALTAWRIAENLLKHLRRADFDIAVGPQYFAILAETLIFSHQVADRLAWQHMSEDERMQFTTTLAIRIAENLAENRVRLMGGDQQSSKQDFIGLLNQRASDYAEFEFDVQAENFSFLRNFAHALSGHLDEKDQHWVSDQIIAQEGPEIIATVNKAMRGLLDMEPRRKRGESGLGAD